MSGVKFDLWENVSFKAEIIRTVNGIDTPEELQLNATWLRQNILKTIEMNTTIIFMNSSTFVVL